MSDLAIYIEGVIDAANWGDVSAESVRQQLTAAAGPIDELIVNINSPGGSFYEGVAIAELIRNFSAKTKTAVVTGLAGSAATYPLFVCETREIAELGAVMIHQAMVRVMGNADELEKIIVGLHTMDVALAQFVAGRTGNSVDLVTAWLKESKQFKADEAITYNLCSGLSGARKKKAARNQTRTEQVRNQTEEYLRDGLLLARIEQFTSSLNKE